MRFIKPRSEAAALEAGREANDDIWTRTYVTWFAEKIDERLFRFSLFSKGKLQRLFRGFRKKLEVFCLSTSTARRQSRVRLSHAHVYYTPVTCMHAGLGLLSMEKVATIDFTIFSLCECALYGAHVGSFGTLNVKVGIQRIFVRGI